MRNSSSLWVRWLRKFLGLDACAPVRTPTRRPASPPTVPAQHDRAPIPQAYQPIPFQGRDGGEYVLIATVHSLGIVPQQRCGVGR